MNDQTKKSLDHDFELDPFVSEIARWMDREVIAERPEFNAIDLAERTALICLVLHENGVATTTKPGSIAVWVATAEMEQRTGGSGIAANACFTLLNRAKASLVARFVRAVRRHAKRRLASILEFTQALFRLCNDGRIRMIGANANGSYLWAPTFSSRMSLAGSKRRSGFEERRTNPKQNLRE